MFLSLNDNPEKRSLYLCKINQFINLFIISLLSEDIGMKIYFFIVLTGISCISCLGQSENYGDNLDYRHIVLTGFDTVIADSSSIKWGKQVLQNLHLENCSDMEKAVKIQEYISENFKYNFKRSYDINETVGEKGGFCLAHAIMGVFLLRLTGIPSQLAHEVHIIKQYTLVSIIVGRWAKKNNDGINSYWHNDHIWVWFINDDKWEPFDSALDLCGFEEFYNKRYYRHKELSKTFAQKWTGPPFVVWQAVPGTAINKNIAPLIWNEENPANASCSTEWLELVKSFDQWSEDDFHREYLPEDLLNKVKSASRSFF